jgi:hypothetical protein
MRNTYCKPVSKVVSGKPRTGEVSDAPMSNNWRAVLTLLMLVGRTSADGIEKSQYRTKVF